jgi:F-type H+-transporting ATPase subunit delta
MDEVNTITTAILNLLKTKGQLPLLPEIIEELKKEQEVLQQKVIIESAIELSDREISQLAKTISQKLKYQPSIINRVDPDLLAGIRLRIGDQVIDISLKNRLEQIRNTIH